MMGKLGRKFGRWPAVIGASVTVVFGLAGAGLIALGGASPAMAGTAPGSCSAPGSGGSCSMSNPISVTVGTADTLTDSTGSLTCGTGAVAAGTANVPCGSVTLNVTGNDNYQLYAAATGLIGTAHPSASIPASDLTSACSVTGGGGSCVTSFVNFATTMGELATDAASTVNDSYGDAVSISIPAGQVGDTYNGTLTYTLTAS
jgi:hypothetical protein